MDLPDEMRIEFNRTRVVLSIFGCLAFIAIGTCMLLQDGVAARARHPDAHLTFQRWAGGLGIVFFGACFVIAVRKLCDWRPGLEFTREGVLDNASGVAAGLIPWSEITGTDILRVFGNRFLIVHVLDPKKYVARGGLLRRGWNSLNSGFSGSPITITSGMLKINFDELLRLFHAYAEKYRGGSGVGA